MLILRRRCRLAKPGWATTRRGERDRADSVGAGTSERLCARGERGAGRGHIVDQECLRWSRGDRTDARRVGEPRRAMAPHLARALRSRETGHEGESASPCERRRERLRRVEPAPPAPKRRGRHRHDRTGQEGRRRPSRHERSGLVRERNPPPELERADQVASDALIRCDGPRLVDVRNRRSDRRQARQLRLAPLTDASPQLACPTADGATGRSDEGEDLLQHPTMVTPETSRMGRKRRRINRGAVLRSNALEGPMVERCKTRV
jgi:hypothetical protein